jgi:hypothetical protein
VLDYLFIYLFEVPYFTLLRCPSGTHGMRGTIWPGLIDLVGIVTVVTNEEAAEDRVEAAVLASAACPVAITTFASLVGTARGSPCRLLCRSL